MSHPDRLWLSERLKYSLQLLACPAQIQLTKFPPFVDAAAEMALDFDNFRAAFVKKCCGEISKEQHLTLDLMEKSFHKMNRSCFTVYSVNNSKEWRTIRELAAEALRTFGWPMGNPPRRDHEFVSG